MMRNQLNRWQVENLLAARYTSPENIERILRRRFYGAVLRALIAAVLFIGFMAVVWAVMSWQAAGAVSGATILVGVRYPAAAKRVCRGRRRSAERN